MLCLCLCSLVSLVTVKVSAAENLIDSDLRNWETGGTETNVEVLHGAYRISAKPSGGIALSMVLTESSFKAGVTYSLSFVLCDTSINPSWADNALSKHYERGYTVTVAVGYRDASNVLNGDIELIKINKDNVSSFFGKTITCNFVAPSGSGTPILFLFVTASDVSDTYFGYFDDFSLVCSDETLSRLDDVEVAVGDVGQQVEDVNSNVSSVGQQVEEVQSSVFSLSDNITKFGESLTWFLHDFKWELIGGECGDDECPKTPHIGIGERFGNALSSLGDSIMNFFHDMRWDFTGGACGKSGCLKSPHTSLGDRIKSFFDKSDTNTTNNFFSLGDSISGFFSGLGDDLSGWFDEQKLKIEGFKTSVGEWFDGLWLKFEAFFDKFKPRVVFDNLRWLKGYVVDRNSGEIIDASSHFAVTSDLFSVPLGSSYKFNVIDSSDFHYVKLYQYDLEGNFIAYVGILTSSEAEDISAISGYSYRLVMRSNSPFTSDNVYDFCNSHFLVYADEGWVNALGHKLKISVNNMFVPSDNFFDLFKTDFDNLLKNNLGFIYESASFLSDLVDEIKILLFESQGKELKLVFPGFELEIAGYNIDLFDKKEVDFSFLTGEGGLAIAYGIYKVLLYIIFGFSLVNYGVKTWDKVMAN